MTRVLSAEAIGLIQREMARFPVSRSALLPALHIAQDEVGYVSSDAMSDVSEVMDIPYSDVEEVVTFYSMFYENKVGTFVLEVCKTVPCGIMGADAIIDHIGQKLHIRPGETTKDGVFTLLKVECLAGCHRAPVMQVNSRYYENLTNEKVDALLDQMRSEARTRAGKKRGEPLPALRGKAGA